MCYSSGSIDQAANPCPMCRVYAHAKCPHIRETCRNRSAHPRMDVQYLTNAEVECFNGCGFCKWANTTPPPPPKLAGYNNAGWPGCCRAPRTSELHLVQIEDWPAVSVVHSIHIPPEIDAILKTLPLPVIKTNNTQPTSPSNRNTPSKPSTPSSVRRNTGSSTPSNRPSILSTKAMNTPPQSRGRSPQGGTSNAHLSRPSSGNAISSSVPSSSSMDTIRRKSNSGTADRRIEGTQSSHSSPSRKSIDLENPGTPRRVSSVRRPALTPATTSVSLSKVVAADTRSSQGIQDSPVRRRSSISGSVSPSTPSQAPRNPDLPLSFVVPRIKDDDCSASSSSGSSDGIGSISDSTITSDGGFTDYLSDESEAELQRQAEARAAVVAQSQAEELEFKMARQQLAHVGLRPPKSWNPTNTTPPKVSS